jgi:hypothetical protein
MSLIMLDLANARIADLHRDAERRRTRRQLVIQQREARRARDAASRRGARFRPVRFDATADLGRR